MEEIDFNIDVSDLNNFYYTNNSQIKKMDDNFILSKIQEKYPDLSQDSTENNLKAVITLIMSDIKFIMEIEKEYNLNTYEVIKIIYRNYDYIFNTCFTTKIQKIIKNKKYGKTRRK